MEKQGESHLSLPLQDKEDLRLFLFKDPGMEGGLIGYHLVQHPLIVGQLADKGQNQPLIPRDRLSEFHGLTHGNSPL